MTPTQFCELMLMLCQTHHASVTSWYRTQWRNEIRGGHPNSRHLYGLAVDVVIDPVPDIDEDSTQTGAVANFIRECERQGLKAIDEGDHIHVQVP